MKIDNTWGTLEFNVCDLQIITLDTEESLIDVIELDSDESVLVRVAREDERYTDGTFTERRPFRVINIRDGSEVCRTP